MRHRRRLLLCAGLAGLVVAAGFVVRWASAPPARELAEPVTGSTPSLAIGHAPGAPASPSGSPAASVEPHGDITVRYTFDNGLSEPIGDAGGRLGLRSRRAEGGELSAVPHDGGLAVRFPPRCEHYGAQSCARAILQSGRAGFLNPGRGSITYGASVLVQPNETSKGANVVQKGFSVGDSQFKLQVDGVAGQPSCVIVGTSSATIFVAMASRSVADGRWHRLACSRGNALLTVAVDGVEAGRTAIPSSLSIANDDPICIGGKGTSANNDQFVGIIDDVFVTRFARP
ncbi:LamG-like jellyroll fold domain-containing protein [Dactylosporangium sp. CA-233914]|uniref:LamG-like jellyroll fold domain-containing protein n=1 Tax=Dactylosporangium sp. CA-233914 TaxID=3239934 RepID=UPI003D8E00CF